MQRYFDQERQDIVSQITRALNDGNNIGGLIKSYSDSFRDERFENKVSSILESIFESESKSFAWNFLYEAIGEKACSFENLVAISNMDIYAVGSYQTPSGEFAYEYFNDYDKVICYGNNIDTTGIYKNYALIKKV